MHHYKTHGTCSKKIDFDIIDGKLYNVQFHSGCHGNLVGLSRLVEGMDVQDVIERCKGIPCQGNTSCPDQLAIALMQCLPSEKKAVD